MTSFTGTGSLIRLALRRDRILLPVWILVFVALAASSAASTADLYPTLESRVQLATTANANPMSYQSKTGKQYVAVVAGTTLVAYSLP